MTATALDTLRSVPLFSLLRDSDVGALAALLQPRHFPRHRVIHSGHEPCEAFYVVISGRVKVMLTAEDGREVVLSLLGPGDFFGEMALMDDELFESCVIATEELHVLVLERHAFRNCLRDMSGVSIGLLRALCVRLRESDHRIGELILLDVTGRVASLFLELAARQEGSLIADPPTHQVIAQMVGSSRETVSRTISSLAAQGIISVSGGQVRIVDRAALEGVAGNALRRRVKPAGKRDRRASQTPPG